MRHALKDKDRLTVVVELLMVPSSLHAAAYTKHVLR